MVDPVIGTGAIAKAVQSAADESGKQAAGLLSRVFGPAADEIGQALGRYTAYRVGNIQRIAEAADRKSRGDGIVPPRLAHSMLEDGSFCDDELMVEYLGGVLAAGRSPSGRDDRAVSWSKMITSMSAMQLRAHFLLYREWAHALHGREVKLGTDVDRAVMDIELHDFMEIMREAVPDLGGDDIATHVLGGLLQWGLVADGMYFIGKVERLREKYGSSYRVPPFNETFRSLPTLSGVELYGWAIGRAGMNFAEFGSSSELIEPDSTGVRRPRVHFSALD